MRLSPNLGLPIAEPGDFATDYPVAIDEPKTLGLDAAVGDRARGYLSWDSSLNLVLPIGSTRINVSPSVSRGHGGITVEPGGLLGIRDSGLYAFTFSAYIIAGSSVFVHANFGTDIMANGEIEALGSVHASVGSTLISVGACAAFPLNAGDKCGLWLNAQQTGATAAYAHLAMSYVGPTT